jgi:hypothetical protein
MESGAWRSLVAHLLWEQGVGGSNPLAPTSLRSQRSVERRLPRRSLKGEAGQVRICSMHNPFVANYALASQPLLRSQRKEKAAANKLISEVG